MKLEFNSPIAAARSLLEKYHIDSPPVNIVKICNKEGIDVYLADFTSIEENVGKSISGLIQKNSKLGYVILVNETDKKARARFTIAHELGHYFLHMKDSDKVITSFRMDRSPKEKEADRFAAELLMPEELIHKEYEKMVIPVSDSLAEKFNVSRQAMRYRLDELELTYV